MKTKLKFLSLLLAVVLAFGVSFTFTACTKTPDTDESSNPEETLKPGESSNPGETLKPGDPTKPGDPSKPGEPDENPPVESELPSSIPKDGWEIVEDNLDGWEMYDLERFTYENFNAVRVINKGESILSGDCFGMNLKSYRYLTFTLVNESDALEVRFEVKKQDGEGQTYKSAITAGYPEDNVTIIDNDYNAAVVNLAAYQQLTVVLEIDGQTETDQMVIFPGSMSAETAQKCRFIVSDIKGVVNTEFSKAEAVSVPSEGYTDISTESFNGNEVYDVSREGGLTVSHREQMKAWSTAEMTLLKNYSWIKFTVKNNGKNSAKLRIDIKKKTEDVTLTGAVEKAYPARYATVNKEQYSLGLTIPAGETIDVAVKLKHVYFDWLVMFFDSFDTAYNAPSGSITITAFKGIIDESIEHKDPNVKDEKKLAFSASNGAYKISTQSATDSLAVSYDNIGYGSYYYIRSDIESFASEYNTFTFTVTNNGPQEVQLRIGITRGEKYFDEIRENINVCNYDQAFGNTTWQDGRGGTYTAVASSHTQVITIKYKSAEAPKQLIIYFDSCKKDAAELRSGNVTIGGFYFSNT